MAYYTSPPIRQQPRRWIVYIDIVQRVLYLMTVKRQEWASQTHGLVYTRFCHRSGRWNSEVSEYDRYVPNNLSKTIIRERAIITGSVQGLLAQWTFGLLLLDSALSLYIWPILTEVLSWSCLALLVIRVKESIYPKGNVWLGTKNVAKLYPMWEDSRMLNLWITHGHCDKGVLQTHSKANKLSSLWLNPLKKILFSLLFSSIVCLSVADERRRKESIPDCLF